MVVDRMQSTTITIYRKGAYTMYKQQARSVARMASASEEIGNPVSETLERSRPISVGSICVFLKRATF